MNTRRRGSRTATMVFLGVVGALGAACGTSEDEVRQLHAEYCDWKCECDGDCQCDFDEEKLESVLASDCGDVAIAFFECVLDLSCDEQPKRECDEQGEALSTCRGY